MGRSAPSAPAAGLSGRSLFLGAGEQTEAAGPWLVALGQRPDAVDAILSLLADKPAGLFCRCDAGEQAVWRHLRTLAQVDMATARKADDIADHKADTSVDTSADTATGTETVLFRYWDPRSIGCVLPLLDPAQFARVLGPIDELLFLDPTASGGIGLRRAVRTPDLPPPPPPRGRLSLNADQVAALDAAMQARSRRRVGLYLREAAPAEVGHLDEAQLDRVVAHQAAEAHEMGVTGELAVGLWSFMRVTTRAVEGHDGLAGNDAVRRFLGDPQHGATPDRRMEALFNLRTRALQGRG